MLTRDLDCTECDQLWREYERATKEFLKLVGQHQIATIQHDSTTAGRISFQLETARQNRDTAREAVHAHAATYHP